MRTLAWGARGVGVVLDYLTLRSGLGTRAGGQRLGAGRKRR
ncbi:MULTISPECIES: hypothetical protein [unclassified Streptomyces]